MDYHSTYTNPERIEIDAPFTNRYKEIRSALFSLLKEDGFDIGEDAYFGNELFTKDPSIAHASFSWLEQSKKDFLLERIEYLTNRLNSMIS